MIDYAEDVVSVLEEVDDESDIAVERCRGRLVLECRAGEEDADEFRTGAAACEGCAAGIAGDDIGFVLPGRSALNLVEIGPKRMGIERDVISEADLVCAPANGSTRCPAPTVNAHPLCCSAAISTVPDQRDLCVEDRRVVRDQQVRKRGQRGELEGN